MAKLDMTLDDIINMNKTSRAGPRTFGSGPIRRFRNRSASRSAPYSSSTARAPEAHWDYGVSPAEAAFPIRGGARVSATDTGTKILISNLHYGVCDDDIKELFLRVGDLKSCSVHYDRSGRSEGTAEIVFYLRRDAEEAIRRYNNAQLDGRPMRIEIVGMNMASPPLLPLPSHGRNGQVERRIRRAPRGGGRSMRKDGGFRRGRDENISVEDLDADLEKYRAEAKETNEVKHISSHDHKASREVPSRSLGFHSLTKTNN